MQSGSNVKQIRDCLLYYDLHSLITEFLKAVFSATHKVVTFRVLSCSSASVLQLNGNFVRNQGRKMSSLLLQLYYLNVLILEGQDTQVQDFWTAFKIVQLHKEIILNWKCCSVGTESLFSMICILQSQASVCANQQLMIA